MTLYSGVHDGGMVCFSTGPGIVERLEHHHHTRFFVIPKQFGVAHIMADRDCTFDSSNLKSAGMIAGRIEMEVLVSTEPFVVTVHYFSGRIDHIDAIMR